MFVILKTSTKLHPIVIFLLFVSALIGTLADGDYLSIARIAWIFLAFLYIIDERFILCSAFFFATFFHSAGFAAELPFTIKHFHITLILGCMSQLLIKGASWDLRLLKRISIYYLPFVLIIGLGFLNYLRVSPSATSLRIPMNLFLTMCCSGILVYLLLALAKKNEGCVQDQNLIKSCISFFVGGIVLQVLLGQINLFFGTHYLDIHIIHDNHMGILTTIGFFYAVFIFKNHTNFSSSKILSFIAMVLLAIGILFSCSRTSWISFLIGSALYLFYSLKYSDDFTWKDFLKLPRKRRVFCSVIIGCLIGLSLLNQNIYARISNFDQLFSLTYWNFVIADTQNFGCFGIYRLRDLQNVMDQLKANPLIGAGFSRSIVDIHGFIFLILAATGLLGLSILCVYGFWVVSKLRSSIIMKSNSTEEQYLSLSVLCSTLAWFLICFMESYFLQFSIWINFILIICVLERQRQFSSRGHLC